MRKVTRTELRSLRQRLENAWDRDTAYEPYGGDNGSSLGQCYVSALVAYLEFEDLNPKLINGDAGRGDNDHFWLEIDGKILDLTADQFVEFGLPPIVWGSYAEFPNYKPLREDTGFIRFLRLLRRCDMEHLLFGESSRGEPRNHTGKESPLLDRAAD